jgi:hypothetical protein
MHHHLLHKMELSSLMRDPSLNMLCAIGYLRGEMEKKVGREGEGGKWYNGFE